MDKKAKIAIVGTIVAILILIIGVGIVVVKSLRQAMRLCH